jgi:hypothetical protein
MFFDMKYPIIAALMITIGFTLIGMAIGSKPASSLHEEIAPRIHATPISGIPNPEPPPVPEAISTPTPIDDLLVTSPTTLEYYTGNYSVIVDPCESALRDWYCRVIYPPNYGTAPKNS